MMGDIIVGITANIFRTYAIYQFMETVHEQKNFSKIIKWNAYILFAIVTSAGYYLLHSQTFNIVTNIIGLFLISYLYQGKFINKAAWNFFIYAINVIVEALAFSAVTRIDDLNEMTLSLIECITSVGIFLCVLILRRVIISGKRQLAMKPTVWIMIISVPVISIFEMYLMWSPAKNTGIRIRLEIIGILIISFSVIYLFDALQDYYQKEAESEGFRIAMEGYRNQIDIMTTSWKKIRSLRHDLKNHIHELRYLAQQEDGSKSLLKYMDEMEQQLVNEKEYVSSGNRDIDGTLNYYMQTAKTLLKDVRIQVSVPEDMDIHNFSLNVILVFCNI